MSVEPLDPETRALLFRLKAYDLQLAFLALLTSRGIKPASRWEKPLPRRGVSILRALGLHVRTVRRYARNGRKVEETLFARDPALPEEYAARFDGRLIDKGRSTAMYEGLFFGYPPCCVKAYVERPYTPNDLRREDQAVLFHWACPGCRVSPGLVVTYRELLSLLS